MENAANQRLRKNWVDHNGPGNEGAAEGTLKGSGYWFVVCWLVKKMMVIICDVHVLTILHVSHPLCFTLSLLRAVKGAAKGTQKGNYDWYL